MNLRAGLQRAAETQSTDAYPGGLLQRSCACGQHTSGDCGGSECSRGRKSVLRRSSASRQPADNSMNEVPSIVHDALSSSGVPLDATTRAFFEPRLNFDLSRVLLHTDSRAAESAQSVNALAYTVGSNVVFAAGQYTPETASGKRLLAHELTHVIQQSSGASSGSL